MENPPPSSTLVAVEGQARPELMWTPTATHISRCILSAFTQFLNKRHAANVKIGDFAALHAWSVRNPDIFWHATAAFLDFPLEPFPLPSATRARPRPHPGSAARRRPSLVDVAWFPQCTTNFSAPFARRALAHPYAPALIYRPEAAADDAAHRRTYTYAAVRSDMACAANSLRAAGVRRGDTVAAMLPTAPPAVVGMLAAAAVGAVWSACSPDFAPAAVIVRLRQTRPVVLFCAPEYVFKGRSHRVAVGEIVRSLPTLRAVVVVRDSRCAPHDEAPNFACDSCSWEEFLRRGEHAGRDDMLVLEPISMSDPVVTMFSSGTTGAPKCIVQGPGILLNQMKEHALHLDISQSSTLFFNTTTGWMLFNWIVAALASGATIVLYDGVAIPPIDCYRLLHIVSEEGVTHFGFGAAYLFALSRLRGATACPIPRARFGTLRTALGTGSPSTSEHFHFAQNVFGRHVQYVSMSGGTEINGCFALGAPWLGVREGELQCLGLGMDVAVFDADARRVKNRTGELVCLNAVPCMPLYFGNDPTHDKYRATYFSRFGDSVWCHGDFARLTHDDGIVISGRSDATLNAGGVRIGTAELYSVVEALPFVVDSLVVEAPATKARDAYIVLFVVLGGDGETPQWREKIRHALREQLSPRHVPRVIRRSRDVPYTFSGKKCEVPVREMLCGRAVHNRGAVRNPQAFDDVLEAIEKGEDEGMTPKDVARIRSKL